VTAARAVDSGLTAIPLIIASIVAGLVLLVAFYFVEIRTSSPLMRVSIFRIRPFGVCATTSPAR
jgi:hypothetical protein